MLNQKPALLLEINKKSQLDIKGVSFVVGYYKYSSFAGLYFNYEEIKALDNKQNIFVLINALIHQKDLEDFKVEIDKLIPLGVNFIVQDLGALSYIYTHKIKETKIIFNGYTFICNPDDYDAFKELFDIDITLSNELKHEEIVEFTSEDIMLTMYGYTPIYQSYRKVVSLFEEYRNQKIDRNQTLYLKEDTRDDMFPTIENEYGTVVFRSKPLSRIENRDSYLNFKYWYISSLFMENEELEKVLEELNK